MIAGPKSRALSEYLVEASWPKGIMCFTGMMLGLYATGNGHEAGAPADFDWFDYRSVPSNP